MSIKPQEYNSLQLHQKAVVLGGDAVYLVNVAEGGIVFSLYAYSSFYIEVLIDNETDNLIDIVAFKEWDRLNKYFEKITLVDIV